MARLVTVQGKPLFDELPKLYAIFSYEGVQYMVIGRKEHLITCISEEGSTRSFEVMIPQDTVQYDSEPLYFNVPPPALLNYDLFSLGNVFISTLDIFND